MNTTIRYKSSYLTCRCVMEEDPIAQKHLARLSRFRGEYDQWGNRLTRTMLNTQHLMEGPEQKEQRKSRDRKKKKKENDEDIKTKQDNKTEYEFSKIIKLFSTI